MSSTDSHDTEVDRETLTDREGRRLDVLSSEAQNTWSAIRRTFDAVQRLLAACIVVFGIAATLALKEKIYEVLIALPFVLHVLSFYVMLMLDETFALAGYRRAIEDAVNEILQDRILLWESLLSARQHKSIAARCMLLIIPLGIVLSSILCIFSAASNYSVFVSSAIIIALSVFFALLILSFVRLRFTFQRSYEACKKERLKDAPPRNEVSDSNGAC